MIEQADPRDFGAFGQSVQTSSNGKRVNLRFIDWIWNVRGSVPLEPGQSSDEAFNKLDPLFREYGTTHERFSDTLTFSKKDQPAQDKMSVFDAGVLKIEHGMSGAVLHYRMSSRALLFCFCMPLLFLFFAQTTIAIGEYRKPTLEAAENLSCASCTRLTNFWGHRYRRSPKRTGPASAKIQSIRQHLPMFSQDCLRRFMSSAVCLRLGW